jgi:hypothetical protein
MRADSIHFHSKSIHWWFPSILIQQAASMIEKLGVHAPECLHSKLRQQAVVRNACPPRTWKCAYGCAAPRVLKRLQQISSNGLHIHSKQKQINQPTKQANN